MKLALDRTHISFDIEPFKWPEVIAECKSRLGNNDHMQAYHLRPWITNGYTLHIRNDVDDNFVTYLGLVCKIKVEQ